MKESNLRKTFLPVWQLKNGKSSKLFRNNTGGFKDKFGQWVFYGVGLWRRKNKKSPYRPVGGGDDIGWTSKPACVIIPEIQLSLVSCASFYNCKDCPIHENPIAVFTSVEYKTKGVPETQDQKDWKKLVIDCGGIAETIKEGEI
jgi:hypothetical protein